MTTTRTQFGRMEWGWRNVRPDLRSSRGYRWPLPGHWATVPNDNTYVVENTGPCPSAPGDGLCLALTHRGATSGNIPHGTSLICGYLPEDVLGQDDDKVRVRKAWVLEVIATLDWLIGPGADLRGASLTGADLRGADLRDATLTAADLTGANLRSADLTSADLRDANLRSASLTGADLTGADLRDADLRGASLTGADLRDADLRGASLTGADLRGADLRDATLTGADLRGADLRCSTLTAADLRGADLRCSTLTAADLTGANLRSADLTSAVLDAEMGVSHPIGGCRGRQR